MPGFPSRPRPERSPRHAPGQHGHREGTCVPTTSNAVWRRRSRGAGRCPAGRPDGETPLGEHRDGVVADLGIDVGGRQSDVRSDSRNPRLGGRRHRPTEDTPAARRGDAGSRRRPSPRGTPMSASRTAGTACSRSRARAIARKKTRRGAAAIGTAKVERRRYQPAKTIAMPESTQIHHGNHNVGETTSPVETRVEHPATSPSMVCFTGWGRKTQWGAGHGAAARGRPRRTACFA